MTDAKSDNKPNEYVTFYAEDFVGGVQNAWGTTLSCYAWYDEKQDKNDGKRPATGGYPGQPMVYLNGSHMMQIPRYTYYNNGTVHEIQGVTMNNYYWDDVHYYKGYFTGTTEYEQRIISTLVSKVKSDVEDDMIFADSGMHSIVIDITDLSVGTDINGDALGENGKAAKYIDYTYDVSTTGGTNKAVLTNKNRTQFVLGMKEADYEAEGKYSAVVVFGAMNYDSDGDGVTDAGEWIVSDNYVSYITNQPANNGGEG